MSEINVFADHAPDTALLHSTDHATIAAELSAVGVRFERWRTLDGIRPGAAQDEILAAYEPEIRRLKQEGGYVVADVISLPKGAPDTAALRGKFLSEHRHAEDEVRFFVAGQGLFSLHLGSRVYEVLCTRGDLIGVPADTPHWFDMGPDPEFVVIRLFINPQGWVAQFSGSDIADRFHRLEN